MIMEEIKGRCNKCNTIGQNTDLKKKHKKTNQTLPFVGNDKIVYVSLENGKKNTSLVKFCSNLIRQ